MKSNDDCQDRRDAIAALVLGELDGLAANEIRQHIDTCRRCRALCQALTEEEEIVQSAFKAVGERSKAIENNLVAQFGKGSGVHGGISGALPEPEKTKQAHAEPDIWRIIMKSPLTKLAVAASVIVACVIGLSLWTGTQSGIALADVLARVEQAKTVRCKASMTVNGQLASGESWGFEARGTALMSREYGSIANAEMPDPNGKWIPLWDVYVSLQKKTVIRIAHKEKSYMIMELANVVIQQELKFSNLIANPGALVKEIMACKYEHLGRSTVDGVDVEGFRTTDPNCRSPVRENWIKNPKVDIKVWVDVKTRLPVRYDDLTSGLNKPEGGTASQRYVLYDFGWDVPATAADFEPPVPAGYEVLHLPGVIDEESAIQGLKRCIELFGSYDLDVGGAGRGPKEMIFAAFAESEAAEVLRLKEEIKGLTEAEKLDRVSDAVQPIIRFWQLYLGLDEGGKDPAWHGETITPKDADKVLMRWKLSDSEYRVIFGDLHAATVTPEKLAELEKTLPK